MPPAPDAVRGVIPHLPARAGSLSDLPTSASFVSSARRTGFPIRFGNAKEG